MLQDFMYYSMVTCLLIPCDCRRFIYFPTVHLLNANWAIVQLSNGESMMHLEDDDYVHLLLDQHA